MFLASIVPTIQANTLTSVFGMATLNINASAVAGFHAAYGYSDSHNPTYGMLGSMSTPAQSNAVVVLLTA